MFLALFERFAGWDKHSVSLPHARRSTELPRVMILLAPILSLQQAFWPLSNYWGQEVPPEPSHFGHEAKLEQRQYFLQNAYTSFSKLCYCHSTSKDWMIYIIWRANCSPPLFQVRRTHMLLNLTRARLALVLAIRGHRIMESATRMTGKGRKTS